MIFRFLRVKLKKSEREVVEQSSLSRNTLRSAESDIEHCNVSSLTTLARCYERELSVSLIPFDDPDSDVSTYAVSVKVSKDGFQSWKLHFMELVDTYRRNLDPRLLVLPPTRGFDSRLRSLLASIVTALCVETGERIPSWAARSYFLEEPWFVTEIDSLKAMSILESDWPFRRNNIFVLDNFLKRA